MGRGNSQRVNKRYFDFSLLFIVLFLLGFGLVMIYSTSSYNASLAYNGDGLYYLRKQIISTVAGLVVMFIAAIFPYKAFYRLSSPIWVVGMAFLLMILTPLGYAANGAKRWLKIFGFSIQPAEIAKVAVIIVTAALITKMSVKERTTWRGIVIGLLPAGIYSAVIYGVTNDLSSAVIVAGIAFLIFLISTPRNYKLYILLILAVLFVVLAVLSIINGWGTSIWGFRGERVLAWRNLEAYADGKGFQTLQALYGIGSGGVFGKGLGKSIQKLGFLPEAQNDMIFSIICEELGLFGGLAVIIMFILLLWRLRDVTAYCTDYFGNLLVVGVFSHIALQVFLNIAVVTNTIPNTGISLPFISYGGSSAIFLLAEIGIVMNVAGSIDFNDTAGRDIGKKRRVRQSDEGTETTEE